MSTWVPTRTLTSACSGRHLALLGAADEASARRTCGPPETFDTVIADQVPSLRLTFSTANFVRG